MSKIEFRVQGPNSNTVATELKHQMATHFGMDVAIMPNTTAPNTGNDKADWMHVVLLTTELVVTVTHVYMAYIHDPAEKEKERLIGHWREIKLWALKQHPTLIKILFGKSYEGYLHESEPEQLHELTKGEVKKASVVLE